MTRKIFLKSLSFITALCFLPGFVKIFPGNIKKQKRIVFKWKNKDGSNNKLYLS